MDHSAALHCDVCHPELVRPPLVLDEWQTAVLSLFCHGCEMQCMAPHRCSTTLLLSTADMERRP